MAEKTGARRRLGDPQEKVGKRHHLLPKFYLRRFADDHERIAVVDRRTGARHVSHIKDTAAERDFYTMVNVNGALDSSYEQLLAEVEKDAASAIEFMLSAFSSFPPDDARKDAVCMFMAFQRVRSRGARRRIEVMGDLYAHVMLPSNLDRAQSAAWLRERGREPTDDEVEELMWLSAGMTDIECIPDPNEHLAIMGKSALRIFEVLRSRPWSLAEYQKPCLLTADEPVAMYMRDPARPQGLLYADEVWLPLDARRLLILGRPGTQSEGRFEASPATANDVNLLVATRAYDSIFMHPDHRLLEGVELPSPLPLFQIVAPAPLDVTRYNLPPTRTRTQRRRRK